MRAPLIVYTVFAIVMVCVVSWLSLSAEHRHAYTEGYCTALGGTVIADWTCDVDGRVVKVP